MFVYALSIANYLWKVTCFRITKVCFVIVMMMKYSVSNNVSLMALIIRLPDKEHQLPCPCAYEVIHVVLRGSKVYWV